MVDVFVTRPLLIPKKYLAYRQPNAKISNVTYVNPKHDRLGKSFRPFRDSFMEFVEREGYEIAHIHSWGGAVVAREIDAARVRRDWMRGML